MFSESVLRNIIIKAEKDKNKNVKELILNSCEKVGFISQDDIELKSSNYIWIETVCNIHLMAMDIIDSLDEDNCIPLSLEDVHAEEKTKAKIIGGEVAKLLILSIPPFGSSRKQSSLSKLKTVNV